MDHPEQLSDEDFDHIEDTIARSAKGRAFLRRYARRCTAAAVDDIRAMLGEVRDLLRQQGSLVTAQPSAYVEVLRRELLEMAGSIEQARREIAALRPADNASNRIVSATNELDAIVTSTERASFEILNAAERLMELVGRVRRAGGDEAICADMEAEITTIFTACSFQDLTGQRTSKVVNALRYIEQRIAAMITIWGLEGVPLPDLAPEDTREDAHLLSGPQAEGQGVSQAEVDAMFDAGAPPPASEPAPAPEPERPSPPPAQEPRKAATPAPTPAAGSSAALDQSAIDALFG